jgi:hypothetical protein
MFGQKNWLGADIPGKPGRLQRCRHCSHTVQIFVLKGSLKKKKIFCCCALESWRFRPMARYCYQSPMRIHKIETTIGFFPTHSLRQNKLPVLRFPQLHYHFHRRLSFEAVASCTPTYRAEESKLVQSYRPTFKKRLLYKTRMRVWTISFVLGHLFTNNAVASYQVTSTVGSSLSVSVPASYDCYMRNLWTQERQPNGYPVGIASYGTPVIVVHSANFVVFQENALASTGVKALAEVRTAFGCLYVV